MSVADHEDARALLGGARRVRTRVRGFAPWAPRGTTLELLAAARDRGWLPKVAATFLTESIRVFGVPREPITFDDATIPMEMQMRRDEIFPSKYLRAADLKCEPIIAEIERAPVESLKNAKGEVQRKPVLYFKASESACRST